MQSKRQITKRALVGMSLVSLSTCLWVTYLHVSASRATRVFEIGENTNYAWISDHSLLLIHENVDSDGQHHVRLSQMDLHTHRETPLTALTEYVNRHPYLYPESFELSPDGRRLLWTGFLTRKGTQYDTFFILGATLDAKLFFSCPLGTTYFANISTPNSFCWQSDSMHWMEFCSRFPAGYPISQIKVRSFGSTDFQSLFGIDHITYLTPSTSYFSRGNNLFCIDDPIYIHIRGMRNGSAVEELDLKPTVRLLHEYPILGLSGTPSEAPMSLSPNGRSIARIVQYGQSQTWWSRIGRYLRLLPTLPQHVRKLIVSNIDGSNIHEIGSDLPSQENDDRLADDLQWSPDGKSLSFVFKSGFYVVPYQ